MPTLTVELWKVTKEKIGKDEAGTVYKVRVRDSDGKMTDCELYSHAKFGPELPAVGTVLPPEARIEPQENPHWLPKLVLPKKSGAGKGGGGFRDTPETRRSIAMQSSEKVAVEIVRLALEHDKTQAEVEQMVTDAARRVYALVQEAEKGS